VCQTDVPGRIAERVPWAYKASLNKVYMDDIYAVVPVGARSLRLALGVFDAKIIDGAVNSPGCGLDATGCGPSRRAACRTTP
jgi:hypothetical protein